MNPDKQSNRFKESPKVRDDRYRKRYNNNEFNYKNNGPTSNIFMRDKKEKEKQFDPTIFSSKEHFPELISSKPTGLMNEKEEEQSMKLYSDIVETEIKKEEPPEEFKLKPGWIVLDKSKNYNKTDDENEKMVDFILIMRKMDVLYERRKKEYIEVYGEDNYEKMYKFPNYDYEYFDRLDYLYELEMESNSNGNNEMYDENQGYDDLYTYETD